MSTKRTPNKKQRVDNKVKATPLPSLQSQEYMEPKEPTVIEGLNREFDRQNDYFCSLIERLENTTDKLQLITQKEIDRKEGEDRAPGLLSDYASAIDRKAILNQRLGNVLDKLDHLI